MISPSPPRWAILQKVLEQLGRHIRVIQVLLGHNQLDTTARYSQVATRTLHQVTSPLERLGLAVEPPPV